MAKTIEKMASKAFQEESYVHDGSWWFCKGANAVLEEIEALMSNGNDKFPYTCVDSIQNLIKQLKGKL